MPLVPYSFTVPDLENPYTFWFNGLTFGGFDISGNYTIADPNGMSGFGLTKIANGDLPRALVSGEFAGYDTASGRDMMLQILITGQDPTTLSAAIQTFAAAMQPQGPTETPFFFTLDGDEIFCCMARPRNFTYTRDKNAFQTYAVIATVQFHATDWRLYNPTQQVSVNFDASGELLTINNALGLAYSTPLLVITAGDDGCMPNITDSSGIFGLTFSGLTMSAGDVLNVDTDFHTAVLWPGGDSGSAYSVSNALEYPSLWGPVPAGGIVFIQATDIQGGTPAQSTLDVYFGTPFTAV